MAASSSATQTQTQPLPERFEAGGPAGLGQMPSMDPRCTPAKHRYEQCFNLWFDDYLASSSPAASSSSGSSRRSSSSERPSREAQTAGSSAEQQQGLGGWLSRSLSSTSGSDRSSSSSQSSAPPSSSSRADLRARYESCAALFEEYRTCVRKAVSDRKLEPLIAEARRHNPFPFPRDLPPGHNPQNNNVPFPFPAAADSTGNV